MLFCSVKWAELLWCEAHVSFSTAEAQSGHRPPVRFCSVSSVVQLFKNLIVGTTRDQQEETHPHQHKPQTTPLSVCHCLLFTLISRLKTGLINKVTTFRVWSANHSEDSPCKRPIRYSLDGDGVQLRDRQTDIDRDTGFSTQKKTPRLLHVVVSTRFHVGWGMLKSVYLMFLFPAYLCSCCLFTECSCLQDNVFTGCVCLPDVYIYTILILTLCLPL